MKTYQTELTGRMATEAMAKTRSQLKDRLKLLNTLLNTEGMQPLKDSILEEIKIIEITLKRKARMRGEI